MANLVDKEEFLENLKSSAYEPPYSFETISSVIGGLPYEDAEIHYGHWIRSVDFLNFRPTFVCSECRERVRDDIDGRADRIRYMICPYCGAHME